MSLPLCTFWIVCATTSATEMAVFPTEVHLTGPEARQRVVVQSAEGALIGHQLRDGLQFQSADSNVATVEEGAVVPRGNGKTTIHIMAAGKTIDVPVVVER